MPSFSPLSTFSAPRIGCGTRGLDAAAWPRAASVGAKIAPNTRQHVKHHRDDNRSKQNRERQSDREWPHRNGMILEKIRQRNAGSVGEKNQDQGTFRDEVNRRGFQIHREHPDQMVAHQNAEQDEEHWGRDHRASNRRETTP